MSADPVPSAGAADRLRAWLHVVLSSGAQVAHDSETVVYLANEGGYAQPHAVPRQGGPSRRLWDSPGRVAMLLPSPTRPEVILARDQGGNEHWQLELLPLADASRGATPITQEPTVIHTPCVWDPDGTGLYFTSNARDRRFFDVYWTDPHAPSTAPRPLRQEDEHLEVLDARDSRLLVARHRTNLNADLLLGVGEGFIEVNPHSGEQYVPSAELGPDAVYAAANPNREFAALVKFRPGRNPEFLREYPGDVEIVRVAPDGRSILLAVNREGWSETHLYDLATGEDRPLRSGPKGVISSLSWCPDGVGFAYTLSHSEGTEVFYRSVETGKERRLTRSPTPLPTRPVGATLHSFRASDGLTIPYWELLPARTPPRGTLVDVHGGPEAQARPTFDPTRQSWVAEGWRVIAPNVRGSLGYGATYVHLDDVGRRMDAVRDLRELVSALLATGRAEPGRIAVYGGSYGGFMVLAALTTYPELFAAGVDVVGISNFLTFLQKTGPWRRRIREAEYGRLVEDAELLRSLSPLFRADRIVAPLLVVHGRNDPRVPFDEAEQIVASLRRRGRPVELLEFPDEGHGLHRREHQLEVGVRMMEFLDRYVPPPGAARTTA